MKIRTLSFFSLGAVLLAAALTLMQVSSYSQSDVPLWGQCGGEGWTGSINCAAGSCCQTVNQYYSQCMPSGSCTYTVRCSSCPPVRGEWCITCDYNKFGHYCCRGPQALYQCIGESPC